jgi:hypothetical protein
VNRGLGTPFISGLDLRPLRDEMYPEATVNQSLAMLNQCTISGGRPARIMYSGEQ